MIARNQENLRRFLSPSSVALIGVGDNSRYAPSAAAALEGDAEIFFVYPKSETVLGRRSYPSLSAIGRPIDTVLSFVSAERTPMIVEEAASLDTGGVIALAAGFADSGSEGKALQDRIQDMTAGSGMALMGPNCMGFRHVRRRLSLSMERPASYPAGGISVVSSSGAMLVGTSQAARAYRGCGVNYLISAGNEAITDMADYVNFLVEDPGTTAIGLILEKIRRPAEFFAATRRAIDANKPVVVLKLARGERSRQITASHTGTLTGDTKSYDTAFRQAGIIVAYDTDELIDRLALFDQLPPHKWISGRGTAVLTAAGGYASLSADVGPAEGVPLPALDSLSPWLHELIPYASLPNPLDATVRGVSALPAVIEKYSASPELDALLLYTAIDENGATGTRELRNEFREAFAAAARSSDKAFILANFSGPVPEWAFKRWSPAVVTGNGLRKTLRGLQSMASFVQYRSRPRPEGPVVQKVQRPMFSTIPHAEGPMACFEPTMELLHSNEIPVAPFLVIPADTDPVSFKVPFAGPYAAKLADVAHRTEHGAVKLNVTMEQIPAAVADLRALACAAGLPPKVVLQPMAEITGELLLGIQGTELGPLVVLGLGGIFVEALRKYGTRMAPFNCGEAQSLIEEFREARVMHGFRGKPAWDLDALADILVNVSHMASANSDWLASLDMNPLIYGPNGYQAVDALLLMR